MSTFLQSYAQVKPHVRLLDVGCGTGDVLEYLPQVKYTGVDISKVYVASARRRYPDRGTFLVGDRESLRDIASLLGPAQALPRRVSRQSLAGTPTRRTTGALVHIVNAKFDTILAIGVLHHLDDEQVQALFRAAGSMLAAGGRIATIDPVFVFSQSQIARWIISKDRGRYVRLGDEYRLLATPYFDTIESYRRDDLYRIPYSHSILICSNSVTSLDDARLMRSCGGE